MGNKVPVVSLVECDGRVRSQVMKRVTGKKLKAVLKANIVPTATIMTDDFCAYRKFEKGRRQAAGLSETT
jgi:predicted metal-binding protein